MHEPRPDILGLIRGARRIRELIWEDPHRPRYHLVPPEGFFNEDGAYHALIGNKNRRPGYEGDCTSLFTSPDLVHWEYQGPFYRSRRGWTLEAEDAACPDFFPVGKGSPTRAILQLSFAGNG